MDIQADSGEINYLNANNDAYAPDIDYDDEEAKEAYVGDREGKDEQASLGDKEGVAKEASVARSLEFSDNKAYIDTIEGDSDNKFWSSFPRDRNSRNFILGGPQKPDMMGTTTAEEEATKKQYRKARKSFTNKERLSLMKSMSNKGVAILPQKSQSGILKGDPNEMVRPMEYMESHCLFKGQTFQLKERLQICIAEQANLRFIKVKIIRSDSNNLIVTGRNFYVCTTYSVLYGWQVSKACCREGDDFNIIPQNHRVIEEKGLQTSFKSNWVGHVLWNAVEDTPGLPYRMMRKLLKPYFNKYVLTNNVLQEACDTAKGDLFGDPDDNVRYAYAIAKAIQQMGHTIKVIFTNQHKTMQTVITIVLKEEMDRKKAAKSSMSRQEKVDYVNNWNKDNATFLCDAFGFVDSPQFKFLMGIFISPFTSKEQFPFLQ